MATGVKNVLVEKHFKEEAAMATGMAPSRQMPGWGHPMESDFNTMTTGSIAHQGMVERRHNPYDAAVDKLLLAQDKTQEMLSTIFVSLANANAGVHELRVSVQALAKAMGAIEEDMDDVKGYVSDIVDGVSKSHDFQADVKNYQADKVDRAKPTMPANTMRAIISGWDPDRV